MRKSMLILSVVALLLLLAAVPFAGGFYFKQNYIALINNNSTPNIKIQLKDYQLGWLHSTAKLHVILHRDNMTREFDINQTVTHGPFIYDAVTKKIQLVYASIKSIIPIPSSEQGNSAQKNEVQINLQADFAGRWVGSYMLPDLTGNLLWQNFQGTFDFQTPDNVIGDIHVTGQIGKLKMTSPDSTVIASDQVTFNTIIQQSHLSVSSILTDMDFGQISWQFPQNSNMMMNKVELQSQTDLTNNKPKTEVVAVTIPNLAINQVNGGDKNIQFNNSDIQLSYDFTKEPGVDIKYSLTVGAMTSTEETGKILAKSFSIAGTVSKDLAQHLDISSLFNLADLSFIVDKGQVEISGIKNKLDFNLDHEKLMKLQYLLNADSVSVSGPDFKSDLKNMKFQYDLMHSADNSGTSLFAMGFPDLQFVIGSDKNYALQNFVLTVSSTTDKNNITNLLGHFTLDKIVVLNESLGPLESQSNENYFSFTWPSVEGLKYAEATTSYLNLTLYPQSTYTSSFSLNSPYGKITINDLEKLDLKEPLQLNYSADSTATNNDHLRKIRNVHSHLSIPMQFVHHYIDFIEATVDTDHTKNLDQALNAALDNFVKQGYLKIEGTNYIADVTLNSGVIRINGIDIEHPPQPAVQQLPMQPVAPHPQPTIPH